MNKPLQILFIFLCAFACFQVKAQFNVLGDAVPTDVCNCFEVTQNAGNKRGMVWRTESFDLSNSFDLTIQFFLGFNNSSKWQGADGMAFIIHNSNTTLGAFGGGFGYAGITPSLGVIIDTYENSGDGDPGGDLDHISLHQNGDRAHNTVNELIGAMPVKSNSADVEDSAYHDLRVVWNQSNTSFKVYFDDE